MKKLVYFIFPLLSLQASCQEQTSLAQSGKVKVGGGCEGCEAVFESPVPFEKLAHSATLPDFAIPGTAIKIYGKVYKVDGKTPAPGVVLYVYHTDHTGNYPMKGGEKGWARRHGYVRGWIRTNEKGEYSFLTQRPAPYPGRRDPAHIHCIVKEPGLNEYYIGDFLFDDDPLVSADEKKSTTIPGGNGVLKPQLINNRMEAKRDIYLGKNVRDYPGAATRDKSGLAIGSNCPAFDPKHVSGPDKNSSACPMCKYGKGQGVMVWWNDPSLENLLPWIQEMEEKIRKQGVEKLRVFVMFMNPELNPGNVVQRELDRFSKENNIQSVAVTHIPSPVDEETAGLYAINPEMKNTVFVYRKRTVVAKYINYDFQSGEDIVKILRL